jgi:hypothetical protein
LTAAGTQQIPYLSTLNTAARKEKINQLLLELPRQQGQSNHPKSPREVTRLFMSYKRERGLGPVPLKIGSFRYTSPFLILML